MRKNSKLSPVVLTIATLAAKNARLRRRLLWGLAESAFDGSLESGGQPCVGESYSNMASVAVKCSNLI
jgi:hypothetical protein